MKKNDDMFFAQDTTATAAVVAQLSQMMLDAPEARWMAVIDGAFDYYADGPLPYAATGKNCFHSPLFEGLEGAAPWLMPITSDEDGKQLLTKLVRHCSGRPMLSFVSTCLTAQQMCEAWANLHWLEDEDGLRMLLRFADTRILTALQAVLTCQEWAAYTTPLTTWMLIDREGKLAKVTMGGETIPTTGSKVTISQSQIDKLLRIAEPDYVIDLLEDTMPDVISGYRKNSDLYYFVQRQCELVYENGVTSFSDLISIVVAALLTGGVGRKYESLVSLLSEKIWQTDKLGEAIIAAQILD